MPFARFRGITSGVMRRDGCGGGGDQGLVVEGVWGGAGGGLVEVGWLLYVRPVRS